MKYREIPRTGLNVSEIGFGVWTLANAHRDGFITEDPIHLMKYACDRGINFFETADVFGFGQGEELLGRAFHEERERVVLATRVGYFAENTKEAMWGSQSAPNLSAKHIEKACEKSLKRLKTDRIDLYQLHHPNISTVERDDLYAALEKLKKQGKIISWGAALATSGEWTEEAKLLMSLRKLPCLQISYDCFTPEAGRELVKDAYKSHTCLMSDFPGQAKLAKYKDKPEFSFLKENKDRTFLQSICKYILFEKSINSVLVDIVSESQINEFSKVSECPDLLPAEVMKLELLHLGDTKDKSQESLRAKDEYLFG